MLERSAEPEAHDKVLDNTPDRIGIWKRWFLRRGENRSARRKTSQSKEENKQQTQSTYDAGSGNRTRDTLVGGERSHHCAIPAPPLTLPTYVFCHKWLHKRPWLNVVTAFCMGIIVRTNTAAIQRKFLDSLQAAVFTGWLHLPWT